MFVVGNKAYPGQIHYFTVNKSHEVHFISDNHSPILYKSFDTEQEVVSCIIELLKEWFPAKG